MNISTTNNTESLFSFIFALVVGYLIGHFAKNIGYYWQRWGSLLAWIFIPPFLMLLALYAELIAHQENIILSLIFVVGFVIGLAKRSKR